MGLEHMWTSTSQQASGTVPTGTEAPADTQLVKKMNDSHLIACFFFFNLTAGFRKSIIHSFFQNNLK